MNNWCKIMKIRATPTIFINGKELPDMYGIKDLIFFSRRRIKLFEAVRNVFRLRELNIL